MLRDFRIEDACKAIRTFMENFTMVSLAVSTYDRWDWMKSIGLEAFDEIIVACNGPIPARVPVPINLIVLANRGYPLGAIDGINRSIATCRFDWVVHIHGDVVMNDVAWIISLIGSAFNYDYVARRSPKGDYWMMDCFAVRRTAWRGLVDPAPKVPPESSFVPTNVLEVEPSNHKKLPGFRAKAYSNRS